MNTEEIKNSQSETEKGGAGALWGTLVIMIILLFGAIYMFNQKVDVNNQAAITNTSDEIDLIEADSKTMDVKDIDVEINSL